MSDIVSVNNVIDRLSREKKSIRCGDVTKLLESLGFVVRDGTKGGHKIYSYFGLGDFHGSSFNCGHGKNPEIKPIYVTNIIDVLNKYESEITHLLEK
jgi:hypothetical protein